MNNEQLEWEAGEVSSADRLRDEFRFQLKQHYEEVAVPEGTELGFDEWLDTLDIFDLQDILGE